MRLEHWPERLLAVIEDDRNHPFAWGHHDCAMLFRRCVDACTGVDPLADLPPWFSAATALRALRCVGFRTAFELVQARFERVPAAAAGRGDVGFMATRDDLSAPAIIIGTEAVSRNEHGFLVIPASELVATFKV